jgi:hypothetical protein
MISWERINHFSFISYGKNSFGIVRPVWYKSKDLERIKDVYRGIRHIYVVFSDVIKSTGRL